MATTSDDGDAPATERVNNSFTRLLYERARKQVQGVDADGNVLTAHHNTFSGSAANFRQKLPAFSDRVNFDMSTATWRAMSEPMFVLAENKVTTTEPLDPVPFHLAGTSVYVFHPFALGTNSWARPSVRRSDDAACNMPRTCSPSTQIPCRREGCSGTMCGGGWAPNLRRVMGVSRTHYLLYLNLRCNDCNGQESSVTDRVLEHLGPAVRSSLPLIITRKGALDKDVFNLISAQLGTGSSFSSTASQLREMHNASFWESHEQYTHFAATRDSNLKKALQRSIHRTRNPPMQVDVPASFADMEVSRVASTFCFH